jgi:hypothetical protein
MDEALCDGCYVFNCLILGIYRIKTWKGTKTSLDVAKRMFLHMPGIKPGNPTHSQTNL